MSSFKASVDIHVDGAVEGPASVTATIVDAAGNSVTTSPATVTVPPAATTLSASLTVVSSS
jgi:hypothetical protein